jgi:hypothetical protein
MKSSIHKQIGNIEIPLEYFKMSEDEQRTICLGLFEVMLDVINRSANPEYDRFMLLDKLLESTIHTNEQAENFEVCAVLRDVQRLINE